MVFGLEGEVGYLGLDGSRIDPNGIANGTPDTTTTFALSMAKPAAKAFLVAGLQTAFMPFKGNVLVPQMDSVIGPLPVGPLGKLGLTFDWPAGMPVGQTVDMQFWIKDPGGIKGFAVSSDAHIVQP